MSGSVIFDEFTNKLYFVLLDFFVDAGLQIYKTVRTIDRAGLFNFSLARVLWAGDAV